MAPGLPPSSARTPGSVPVSGPSSPTTGAPAMTGATWPPPATTSRASRPWTKRSRSATSRPRQAGARAGGWGEGPLDLHVRTSRAAVGSAGLEWQGQGDPMSGVCWGEGNTRGGLATTERPRRPVQGSGAVALPGEWHAAETGGGPPSPDRRQPPHPQCRWGKVSIATTGHASSDLCKTRRRLLTMCGS